MFLPADVRGTEHTHALRVRGHDAVLDSVVDHFDEMAGAVWPAMEIALLGCAVNFVTSAGTRNVTDPGSEPGKDGIQMLHDLLLAADHHAVTTFKSPNTAARADVYVVDISRRKFLGPPNVVDIIRIAAVDQNVVGFEMRQEIPDRFVDNCRGNH